MSPFPDRATAVPPLHAARLLAVALALLACGPSARPASDDGGSAARAGDTAAAHDTPARAPDGAAEGPTGARASADTSDDALVASADGAVAAIARRDWGALAALAHPGRGVRFTPYGHVEPAGDCTVTLTRAEVAALGADTTTRCWGHFDGSGEPIRLPFAGYAERFVHDRDFRDARRGAPNERIGQGNTLSNVPEAFGPGAAFVEYHVPGTERYDGMDWASLRLVFAPHDAGWRLVGIVHDQWTI